MGQELLWVNDGFLPEPRKRQRVGRPADVHAQMVYPFVIREQSRHADHN